MVYMGKKGQNEAMDECKGLNAQLPLPKSKAEVSEFRKIIRGYAWIGIRDLTKSGLKNWRANWKDVEGNPIGDAHVNLRVIILFSC